MTGKRAVIGEGISTIYRLVLISLIAFTIFFLSGIFYSTDINVKDVEAELMAENVINCLAPKGIFDLSLAGEEDKKNILRYCGYDDSETSRFYVRGSLTGSGDEVFEEFSQGDSKLIFVKELFEKTEVRKDIKKYEPGHYEMEKVITYVLESGKIKASEINLEVYVNDES